MNNIVPKRTLALWVGIWAATLAVACALALIFSGVDRANASTTHKATLKSVVFKTDSWSSNRYWAAPDVVGAGTHIEHVTNTVTTTYLFWPDGGGVNKLAITNVDVCYTLHSRGILFQGLNANPYYLDDTSVINPGAIEVPHVIGSDHECDHYTVPISSRTWFRMDQDPAWHVSGKIRLKFTNDDDYDFDWGGQKIKYFHPGDDPEDGGYFLCECDYGGGKI